MLSAREGVKGAKGWHCQASPRFLLVKGAISSTWNQTGTVSGRLSAKQPVGSLLAKRRFLFLRGAPGWQSDRIYTHTPPPAIHLERIFFCFFPRPVFI